MIDRGTTDIASDFRLASAGDVNDDGRGDILISATNAAGDAGWSFVFIGGADNLAAHDAADGDADGHIRLIQLLPDDFLL